MGQTTVYIDILILTNMFVNYLLISCTSKLLSVTPRLWRTLAASFVGGLLSLALFLQAAPSLVVKMLGASVIVLIVYSFQHIRRFLKALLVFFAVSFLFAGVMLALYYFVSPPGMVYDGSLVYFDISAMSFVMFTILSYTLLSLLSYVFKAKLIKKGEIVSVEVRINGRSTLIKAKLDTGNNLLDVFSGVPVFVCEYAAIAPILPPTLSPLIQAVFDGAEPGEIRTLRTNGFRMIPCRTIAGQSLMPALRPDLVKIYEEGSVNIIKDVMIGICRERILSSEYDMLLNPNLPEGIYQEVKKDEEMAAKAVLVEKAHPADDGAHRSAWRH